ncbi:MAG: metallophosphoesterase [Planctomycetota bacterium]
MRRFGSAIVLLVLASIPVLADSIVQFGVITDPHHCNQPNSTTRFYSAALPKTQQFVSTMNAANAAFVVELGDYVDRLVGSKDPLVNLGEIESIYTGFNGPHYHVLGNHEFDNLERNQMLYNVTNTGVPQGQTYYSFDVNGVHCVVLDADYTVAPPHRPFDMLKPGENWWNWKDAWVPQEELDWLAADLAASNLPTFVFSHQLLNRVDTEDHTIKNASVVRALLEADGDVLAAFAGHDHAGDYSLINGVHYFVLEANVGMGTHPIDDNQYALIELNQIRHGDGPLYELRVNGYGHQDSYSVLVPEPASLTLLSGGALLLLRRRA